MLKFVRKYTFIQKIICLCIVLCIAGTTCSCNLLNRMLSSLLVPERRTVAFSEMTYTRPDFKAVQSEIETLKKQIEKDNVSYKKQLAGLRNFNRAYWDYYSMYSLCYVHYALDTTDSYYKDEYAFFGETNPKMQYLLEDLFVACNQSKHKKRFEADYFGEGYLDAYDEGSSYSPELVEYLQQEAKYLQQYHDASADDTITYLGQKRPFSELMEEARTEAEQEKILSAYKVQTNKKLGEIYVNLVKTRLQIAKLLGYDSYAAYAYETLERDYTASMGAQFVNQVETYLVPLYKELTKDGVGYPELPALSWQQISKTTGKALSGIDPAVKDIYTYLEEYQLYDAAPSSGKIAQDFTTYIENYDAPFMIINPRGNWTDVLTFAHEFGHFTDMYLNYNTNYSLDLSECASMSMEYLILPQIAKENAELSRKLSAYKMYDTLSVYITQSAYTAFEQKVYQLSPEHVNLSEINSIARDVAQRFGSEERSNFEYTWAMIPHFYEKAFYCISYCFSNDVAFQIYQKECEQAGSGADVYLDLIQWDAQQTFLENIQRVGLVDPCAKGRMQEMRDFLADYYGYSDQAAAA
ncbi:MAG: hypothetical protein J6L76_03145 [Clostridia bacterium]|nr:hypothetical protein [Clostridia bacterium]